MSSPEERIRELARQRTIDDAAAAQLLDAVRPVPRPSPYDPLARLSPAVACGIGLLASLVLVALGRLHIRTDGVLDLHVGRAPVPLSVAAIDQLVAWPLSALVVWGVARLLARGVRIVDVLATVALGRVPHAVLGIPLALLTPGAGVVRGPVLYLILALALAVFGAQVLLLGFGFRTATGLRGGKLAVALVGGLVAAEIVSKIVLSLARPFA